MKILLINGANLNMLGIREPEKYGEKSLKEIEEAVIAKGKELGAEIYPYQSNIEGEIVEQILAVEQDTGEKISNVVFMGIGEPLDNYENVIKAIRILNNQKGLNIGARHISVSTSGLVPKIYDLAKENIPCTLSISLHATSNEKRSKMMPVNNAYPIEKLIKACKDYIATTNRRISF